jgi:transposase-like protein
MAYKVSPTPKLTPDNIEAHINKELARIGSDKTYADVFRLRHTKIGKRNVSAQAAADEVGISRNTMIKWWRLIDEKEHAES